MRYQLAHESRVEFSIYDVTGRRVATIERGPRPAGYHSAAWDGREASGRPAAAGVYFARLEAAGTRYEQKIILLR